MLRSGVPLTVLLLGARLLAGTAGSDPTPIPELKRWEKNMVEHGARHTDERSGGVDESFVWYYDGQRVFYQIADYTGDAKWKECAEHSKETYRQYVFSNEGRLPGWRIFPHGLYEDFKRTGDEKSKEAVLLLARNSAFAAAGGGEGCPRENAYILMAFLLAEELGEKKVRLQDALKFSLGTVDQWCVGKTAKHVQPFMAGLIAEALILYEEKRGDARIIPTLRILADWLWEQCWVAADESFCYLRERPNDPATAPKQGAADLNLLIAPLYAWLYKKTGEVKFRERGDQVFAGGVRKAWINDGKHFSQNYRWSFDYVKWRSEGPGKAAPEAEAKAGSAKAKETKERNPGAVTSAVPVAAASVPTLDPAPYRTALEACLKKAAKSPKGTRVFIQSLKQEVELANIGETGLRIVLQGNELPLRWKELSNEDLARLALICCDEAEGLFQGGALAAATKLPALREKIFERLLQLDPKKADELRQLK